MNVGRRSRHLGARVGVNVEYTDNGLADMIAGRWLIGHTHFEYTRRVLEWMLRGFLGGSRVSESDVHIFGALCWSCYQTLGFTDADFLDFKC